MANRKYVPRFVYRNMDNEVVAADGARRGYRAAKRIVKKARAEFRLDHETHEVLQDVQLAPTTKAPKGMRLVLGKTDQAKLSKPMKRLIAMLESGPITPTEARKHLGISSQSLSRLLASLVKRGLIRRLGTGRKQSIILVR